MLQLQEDFGRGAAQHMSSAADKAVLATHVGAMAYVDEDLALVRVRSLDDIPAQQQKLDEELLWQGKAVGAHGCCALSSRLFCSPRLGSDVLRRLLCSCLLALGPLHVCHDLLQQYECVLKSLHSCWHQQKNSTSRSAAPAVLLAWARNPAPDRPHTFQAAAPAPQTPLHLVVQGNRRSCCFLAGDRLVFLQGGCSCT